MKGIKRNYPPHIQQILDQLDGQIAQHREMIQQLEFSKQMWMKHQPEGNSIVKEDAPLTRDTIRNFLKAYGQPTQTVNIIGLIYPKKSEEEKTKLVKTLSVILNQMAKEGEVTIEKRKGVKGNFYKWKKS